MVEGKAPQGGQGLDTIVQMGGDPESPFTSMVAGVSSALAKMQEMLPEEGVKPELVAKLASIDEQYKAVLQEIMQSMSAPQGPQGQAPDRQRVDAHGGMGGVPMPS